MLKLKHAEAIKEVFYLEWLANTVVVKKKTGKWRICVDFTNLNKAYLKSSNRSVSGCNCRSSLDKLLGCLSRVPSNTIGFG